ncbi:MAG: hypothetical protein NC924_00500 [Candidatus Omnitrophica bacterium]|nr:hypothetical protein [Candidatus Omnitrophota bacterium]
MEKIPAGISPAELLKIAVDVEHNGEQLYAALEHRAMDERVRSIWHFLRAEEVRHREIFEEILDNLTEYVVVDNSPQEWELYMQAIAAEFIVTPQLIAQKIKEHFPTEIAAVEFGIALEKDSILAYGALRDRIVNAQQPVIDRIIREEKKHLVKLCQLKSYFNKER